MTAPAARLAASTPSWATLVLAPNPGPMTLDGTNSWVLRAPDEAGCLVVDPGPLDEAHLRRLADAGPVECVLITHSHHDHTESVDRFAELTGAQVRAMDRRWCRDAPSLVGGEVIKAAGLRLEVIAAPGHTADSVAFLAQLAEPDRPQAGDVAGRASAVDPETAVLTGDTVLGRGTTVVAYPDGDLGDYLASLARLARLCEPGQDGRTTPALPGHGPILADCAAAAERYLAHRTERLNQVRDAVRAGARTASEVVEIVYADVVRDLWPAAELSVRAQLAYLEQTGSGSRQDPGTHPS